MEMKSLKYKYQETPYTNASTSILISTLLIYAHPSYQHQKLQNDLSRTDNCCRIMLCANDNDFILDVLFYTNSWLKIGYRPT